MTPTGNLPGPGHLINNDRPLTPTCILASDSSATKTAININIESKVKNELYPTVIHARESGDEASWLHDHDLLSKLITTACKVFS